MRLATTSFAAVSALSVLLAGCSAPAPRVRDARPQLVEKGRYQVLYRGDGSRERVVFDADSDGDAEVVILYTPAGAVERSELDTDGDGRVDRWEYFDSAGRLARVDRAVLQ